LEFTLGNYKQTVENVNIKITKKSASLKVNSTQNCEHFWYQSSGHLSNRINIRFFFIFSKTFAVFDDFSKWRECQMCCRTCKNHQIYQKLQENEENLAIFTVILMATFGTKNVHSVMCVGI